MYKVIINFMKNFEGINPKIEYYDIMSKERYFNIIMNCS